MTSFWEGMLADYRIAIPVGAIAVLIIDVGLRRGFGLGLMAGAGAATKAKKAIQSRRTNI